MILLFGPQAQLGQELSAAVVEAKIQVNKPQAARSTKPKLVLSADAMARPE